MSKFIHHPFALVLSNDDLPSLLLLYGFEVFLLQLEIRLLFSWCENVLVLLLFGSDLFLLNCLISFIHLRAPQADSGLFCAGW